MSTRGTVDNGLVKKPHTDTTYSPQQLRELQACSHPTSGPEYFMSNFMKIQHPTKGAMVIDLFDFQKGLIDAYHNYRYSIALISRQMGKSTVAGGYLLWYAMFVPDSTILIASNVGANAMEIMMRVRFAYENCPDHIRAGVTEYNKSSIVFDNGSRIVAKATTENTGRGMSISLVYLDEFAFVRGTIAAEFWTALSPTLSTGGKCIITSTPNTDDDTFARIWQDANKLFDEHGNETEVGVNDFKPYFADWTQHPERDEDWARKEEAKVGSEKFKREHLCQFIAFSETLIDSIMLANMHGLDPLAKLGQVRWYEKVDKNKKYIVSLDPSTGTGGDKAAIQIIEASTLTQVGEWTHNKTPVEGQMKIMMNILQYIREQGVPDNQLYWSVENNGIGEGALVVIRHTGEENFPGTMISEPKKTRKSGIRKGYFTGARSKIEACIQLKRLIETGKLTINSKPLITELKHFVAIGNTYKAQPGEHDDLVMAMILAVRMLTEVSKYEDDVYDAVNSDITATGLENYMDEDEGKAPMPVLF